MASALVSQNPSQAQAQPKQNMKTLTISAVISSIFFIAILLAYNMANPQPRSDEITVAPHSDTPIIQHNDKATGDQSPIKSSPFPVADKDATPATQSSGSATISDRDSRIKKFDTKRTMRKDLRLPESVIETIVEDQDKLEAWNVMASEKLHELDVSLQKRGIFLQTMSSRELRANRNKYQPMTREQAKAAQKGIEYAYLISSGNDWFVVNPTTASLAPADDATRASLMQSVDESVQELRRLALAIANP